MKTWLTLFLLTLLSFPLAANAADDDRIKALEQRIDQLEQQLDLSGEKPRVEEEATKEGIKFGGAVRVNYNYQDWQENDKDRYGEFDFDTFRLNLDGEIKDIIFSAEYRFYPQDDWNAPHHAWFGYNINDDMQAQLGIQQVPFGLQPYASHNFWFSGAYYVGLEDDYDLGVKFLYTPGPLSVTAAFYKNSELGNPGDAGRYSVDVINNADGGYAGAQAAGNEESNQFNGRIAYTLDHGDLGSTEFGVSGEWGQLYNSNTEDNGDHWASAVHMNGNYGQWNVQLEYAAYGYNPENPSGFDDDIITMGAYSYSWGVPAEAQIGIANVSYTVPMDWGILDSLTFYSDNTIIEPDESRFDTIWQNVVGCLIATGPVYTYVDIISAENMIFMGGDMVGDEDASFGRNTRLNINFGYYF